jgi:hypothetical protein
MTTSLPSTNESPAIERRISRAFSQWWRAQWGRKGLSDFRTVYEHGHWWILAHTQADGPVTFDAVDAEGGDAVDGFSFERLA